MNNIIETKILTTSTTLAICMVGWVKPEKQQQILLNDLMSNGHKRYINTTDWQTMENINNPLQSCHRCTKTDKPLTGSDWLKILRVLL